MGDKITRTKLRLGIVPPKRFAQNDGVTNRELEALLPSRPAAGSREAGTAAAKERKRARPRSYKETG